ncbi:MAG TPA: histidine phosphatase family protein [Candidatus Binataceae bacterium]|nr:histidine phosphatase family protein [Candidatus Binataceae bacterium]
MGRLILVRHGESVGNVERVFTTTPITLALTETGRGQARAAAARIRALGNPRMVVASRYVRARDTGMIIAEELSLPIEIRDGLHERETGEYAGKPYDSILNADGYDRARPWLWTPPGGESYEQVRGRVGPILDEMARRFAGDDLVIVSHGGVMLAMWAHVTGSWEGAHVPANCGIVVVEHRAGRYLKPEVVGDSQPRGDAGG